MTVCIDYKISVNQLKILIDAGADAHFYNEKAFINQCSHGDKDVILYFILKCACNVNACKSIALTKAIYSEQYDVAKILIESNINVTENAIVESFNHDKKYFDLLLNNYVLDYEHIAKLFFSMLVNNKISHSKKINLKIIKDLIMCHGVIFNEIIINNT